MPHQIPSCLNDHDLVSEKMYLLDLVCANTTPPSSFHEDFVDSYCENQYQMLKAMGLKWDDEYDDDSESELVEYLTDKNATGFLIQFSTGLPRDFSFTDNGEIRCFNSTRSITQSCWFHGASPAECVEKAILWRRDLVEREAEAEKKDSFEIHYLCRSCCEAKGMYFSGDAENKVGRKSCSRCETTEADPLSIHSGSYKG